AGFNPRLPVGGDLGIRVFAVRGVCVSIRASLWEATKKARDESRAVKVSIRASLWEATLATMRYHASEAVSIRASLWEATA
ncbi:MAG: hypothetical protein ACQKBW_13235, partial [Puniceicoccales bacterium]